MVVGTGVIFMMLRSLSLDDTCLHANRLQLVLPTNVSSLSPFMCQTIFISSGTFDIGLALLDLDTLQHDWRQISPGGGGVGWEGMEEMRVQGTVEGWGRGHQPLPHQSLAHQPIAHQSLAHQLPVPPMVGD